MTNKLKVSGIYAIIHTESKRRYIGSAVNIRLRWRCHITELNKGYHGNGYLQKAWNKYGSEAFKFIVIEWCPIDQLLQQEQIYIDEKSEFNILTIAGSRLGKKHTPEACAKISAARSGKPLSVKHRASISEGGKGRVVSPEARKQISERQMGAKNHRFGMHHTEEHKAALRESNSGEKSPTFGRKHTEKEKIKMRAAWKGRVVSEEVKNRLRIAMLGKKHSVESKIKMSEKMKARWKLISPEERSVRAHKIWEKRRLKETNHANKNNSGHPAQQI